MRTSAPAQDAYYVKWTRTPNMTGWNGPGRESLRHWRKLYRRYWRAARATAYGVTGDYGRDCTCGKNCRRKVPTPSRTMPTALAARKM